MHVHVPSLEYDLFSIRTVGWYTLTMLTVDFVFFYGHLHFSSLLYVLKCVDYYFFITHVYEYKLFYRSIESHQL